MKTMIGRTISRRRFVAGAAASMAAAALPFSRGSMAAQPDASLANPMLLHTAPGKAQLLPAPQPTTPVWSFNGSVPGPELRVPQGAKVRVRVRNGLAEETTVHWHGVRVPNGMDGVPHLTQPPIKPGGEFLYEFDAVDAGTFWYHPHQRSFEQVGRGLYGALIVEEPEPVRVDRDIVWVLDDWRLLTNGAIRDDFGNGHDRSHGGRFGNAITVSGQSLDKFDVQPGERIRLRLINAANARTFGLEFTGHEPIVVAIDGQPVTPHAAPAGRVVLGAAMRVDVVIDMAGEPGGSFPVVDTFYEGLEYKLLDLAYGNDRLRTSVPDWPLELPPNPLSEPDLDAAETHEIVFNGGMMGGMVMAEMGRTMHGGPSGMMTMMRSGRMWFINGEAADGHTSEPFLTLARGSSHRLEMVNATAWHHPIHFHGHSFRVLTRNGTPTARREWQDTVLMAPREKVEIAFVADNPGDWMFHCHVLEHQAAGMMGVIRVL